MSVSDQELRDALDLVEKLATRALMTGHPSHVIFEAAFEVARDRTAALAAQWIAEQKRSQTP